MNEPLDTAYGIFSQKLSKLFILIGLCAFALEIFIAFLADTIGYSQEIFNYLVTFVFLGLIAVGLFYGHYKSKEPIWAISFIGFLFLRVYQGIVSDSFGVSFLANAGAPRILLWVFTLIYDVAFVAFLVFVALVYLFKIKKLKMALQISYLATLGFAFLAWVFGIVFAATGGAWENAVLPLFEATSLLFLPGMLEDHLPGELETPSEEAAE